MRTEESHFRCRRDSFAQDLQTLTPDLAPGLRAHSGDVSFRSRDVGHDARWNRITHGANNGDRVCRGFETQNESCRSRYDNIRFRAHYLAAELGIALLLYPAGVWRDDQIDSLDVTKAAQLLEKRGVVWIAPTFAHVSNGGRGVNEGDAMRLYSLLRARHHRPRGRNDNSFNEIAPSHCLPRGSGRGIVATETSGLEGGPA